MGATVWANYDDLVGRNDLYCMGHNITLNGGSKYPFEVQSYVEITGNVAKSGGRKTTCIENGAMAYIIAQRQGYGSVDNYTTGQFAMYNYKATWYSASGRHLGVDSTFGSRDAGRNSMVEAAEKYAEEIGDVTEDSKVVDNKKTISKKLFKDTSGEYYIEVGPFNYTFPGKMKNFKVKNANGNNISSENIKFFQKKNKTVNGEQKKVREEISTSEIKSGKNFYIAIKASSGIKKIKATTGKVKTSEKIYTAKMWFLIHSGNQPLLLVKPGEKTLSGELDFDFNYDIDLTGDIEIEKVDEFNDKIKLPNVKFIVKNIETGKYVHKNSGGEIEYKTDRKDATEFATEAEGENKGKLTIKGLLLGRYYFYEVENPNKGYEAEPDKAIPCNINSSTNYKKIENRQKYVDISGFVWEDIYSSKASQPDDIRDTGLWADDPDEPMGNILVRLVDHDGEEVASVRTYSEETEDSDGIKRSVGEYVFKNIEIDKLPNYDIIFEYNGLIYENIPLWKDVETEVRNRLMQEAIDSGLATEGNKEEWLEKVLEERGSKASENSDEVDARQEFNNRFAVVEEENNKDRVQAYNEEDEDEEPELIEYTLEEEKGEAHIKRTDAHLIKATINNAGVYLEFDREKMAGTTEISGYNLGLWERPQADIALRQDLQDVDVGVKGVHHVYQHGDEGYFDAEDGYWSNLGVEFPDYQQPLYRADVEYESEEEEENFTISLTYKVGLRNETSSITTQINSFANYYDSRYELAGVGMELNEEHKIEEGSELDYTERDTEGDYKIIDIDTELDGEHIKLAPYEIKYVYIQFKLSRENILEALNESDGTEVEGYQNLETLSEVTSYSSYKDDEIYAAVDKDAVLGNVGIGEEPYEDDTNAAPPVNLVISEPRMITGTVFEDEEEEPFKEQNLRQGDGEFKDGENLISNVKVELFEKTEDGEQNAQRTVYKDDENNPYVPVIDETTGEIKTENIEVTTGDDGTYALDGFTPGEYIVRFTWGDDNYKVVDYKSTIYDKERYDGDAEDPYFYRNITDETVNLNRATDDYETRKQIDDQLSKHQTSSGSDEDGYNYATEVDIDKMQSNTLTMKFDVEFDSSELDAADYVDGKLKFVVGGMNLGIIRRPIQAISTAVRVSHIGLGYSNQDKIIDTSVSEDGKFEDTDQGKHVAYVGSPQDRRNAQIKVELDNEVLGNASINLTYDYTIRNESERDYYDENYYKHGIIPDDESKLVTLTPTKVVNYLGKQSDYTVNDRNKDNGWASIQITETENPLKDWVAGFESDPSKYNVDGEGYKKALEETKIYTTTKLSDQVLKPGDEAKLNMDTEKKLTSTEDYTLINELEVVEIGRTYGSQIVVNKEQERSDIEHISDGNYTPLGAMAATEPDDAMAEQVIIVPSTGANKNYVPYIAIGLTALVVLAGGIYFIRRKTTE